MNVTACTNKGLLVTYEKPMNILFLAPILIAGQNPTAPHELKSHITDASVFKSGLVMLTREVTVPEGDAVYSLDVVPQAIDGSFWYSSPDGLLVTDVETTLRINDEKIKISAQTVEDYLAANVGQHVKLMYRPGPYGQQTQKAEPIEGVISGPPKPQSNMVSLKYDNGRLTNLFLANIEEIDTKGLKSEIYKTIKIPQLKVRFRGTSSKPAHLRFLTMETGALWTGNYLVNLGTNGASKVVGKAQIAVGRLAFDDTNVKVIAGQPLLLDTGRYDLASGVGSAIAYLDKTQDSFLNYHPGGRDPYTLVPQYASDAAQIRALADQGLFQAENRFYGMGGMGGGGGLGGAGGPAYPASSMAEGTVSLSNRKGLSSQASTDRLESLYAYPIGKVSLDSGDRLSRLLFSQDSTYESIYKWQAEVGNENTIVQNILRIKNTGTVPWTGGQVLITKDNTPLAQVEMPFTAGGKTADIGMASTQDIVAKKDEFEIVRDTIPMPGRPKAFIVRTTNEVHLSVESSRLEPSKFELTLSVPGEVIESVGGKAVKMIRKQDPWNPQSVVTWSFTLSPGDKREVKIKYTHLG